MRRWGAIIFALAIGLTIGASAVNPAVAHVGTDVGHVWSKHIKSMATRVFYTKAQSNQRYYTKHQANSRFAAKTAVYTKNQADARFSIKTVVKVVESDAEIARTLVALCPTGYVATGGGDRSDHYLLAAFDSRPYMSTSDATPIGWLARFPGTGHEEIPVAAYAICVQR